MSRCVLGLVLAVSAVILRLRLLNVKYRTLSAGKSCTGEDGDICGVNPFEQCVDLCEGYCQGVFFLHLWFLCRQ